MQYAVTLRQANGDHPRTLGVVVARSSAKALAEAEQRWPFAPVGWLAVQETARENPKDHLRGFDLPEVQAKATSAAQTPEAKAKRAATRARIFAERRAVRAAMTPSQRHWHDLQARRRRGMRKANDPAARSDGAVAD